MPLLFLVAGLILIVTVIRGTVGTFSHRFASDVSGGYLKWLAAILVIGGLGYAPPLKEPSRYLLGLVALVILLSKGSGFISMFAQQISNPGTATTTQPAGGNNNLPSIPVQTSSGGGAGAGTGAPASSNPLSQLSSAASLAPVVGSIFGL